MFYEIKVTFVRTVTAGVKRCTSKNRSQVVEIDPTVSRRPRAALAGKDPLNKDVVVKMDVFLGAPFQV